MTLRTTFLVTLSLMTSSIREARAADTSASPMSQTESLIQKCGAPQPAKASGEACVDSFFDFEAIAFGALAPHQAALGPSRYSKCVRVFSKLLRARARGASSALGKAKIDFSQHAPSSALPEISLQIHDEKAQEIRHVTLCWKKTSDSKFKVVDVKLEDASIVLDYRNQFARILKKGGPDMLLQKIQERLPNK